MGMKEEAEAPGAALPTVIFVCGGNSARSVAAEHLSNKFWAGRCHWISAGTSVKRDHPKEGVIRALREVAGVAVDDDVRCRKLEDLLLQFTEEQGGDGGGSPTSSLMAIIILCCNADAECPRFDKLIPSGTLLMREPLQGPMEKIQLSCSALGGRHVEAEVYKEFVLDMQSFVCERLPALLPGILA